MDAVAPELRPAARRFQRFAPRAPRNVWALRLMQAVTRLVTFPADLTGVARERRREGGVDLRLFTPDRRTSDAALLWIHGGGLILGAVRMDDALCAATARRLGVVVASVEYRLAPDHPFPAASDDCLAAWDWLQRHSDALGVDPLRVAVGGQSAGAGLAAGLAQRLHDRHAGTGDPAAVAQWLFAPMLDDRTAARRELDAIRHLAWDNRSNRIGWASYLGAEPGVGAPPPYAVPGRRDDLAGLPPAWIGVGDIDLFFAEDCAHAEGLSAAGVPVTIDVVAGAPHAFETWAPGSELARAYVRRAQDWLAAAVAA